MVAVCAARRAVGWVRVQAGPSVVDDSGGILLKPAWWEDGGGIVAIAEGEWGDPDDQGGCWAVVPEVMEAMMVLEPMIGGTGGVMSNAYLTVISPDDAHRTLTCSAGRLLNGRRWGARDGARSGVARQSFGASSHLRILHAANFHTFLHLSDSFF